MSMNPILSKVPDRTPVSGTFELTVRCNLKCKMCLFRHDDSENGVIKNRELTASQWIDMAKQTAQAGTLKLLITGGEPFLRPDFCEIWEGIYKQGFIMELYTNASLTTPAIIDTLKKYPPHKIGVTIYGASEETYEKVCGNGSAFTKTVEGIKKLMTLPSAIDLRTTIIKDNFDDLDEIHQLAKKEFNIEHIVHTRLVTKSVRGACADVASCRLEPEDNLLVSYKRGIDIIKNHLGDDYDENRLSLEYVEAPSDSNSRRITLLGCDAGMHDFTISWDGLLLSCQMIDAFKEYPLEKGFKKAWEEFPVQVKLPPANPKCLKCNNLNICSCCPASRYAETGLLNGCPEYVCKDTEAVARLIKDRRI